MHRLVGLHWLNENNVLVIVGGVFVVIFVNIRKVKDPDCFTCNANIKQQKAEVNMIANEHVSFSSDKNFNSCTWKV